MNAVDEQLLDVACLLVCGRSILVSRVRDDELCLLAARLSLHTRNASKNARTRPSSRGERNGLQSKTSTVARWSIGVVRVPGN